MSKQALLNRLNERLEVFKNFEPKQLVEMSASSNLVEMIIKDVEELIKVPETDGDIVNNIVALAQQLRSPTLRQVMDQPLNRLDLLAKGLPEEYTIEFVVDNGYKVYPDGGISIDKVAIIKKFREAWFQQGVIVGLYEAKIALDVFLEQHEEKVIRLMTERSRLATPK